MLFKTKELDEEIKPEIAEVRIKFTCGKEITPKDRIEILPQLNNPQLFNILVGHDGINYGFAYSGAISPFVLREVAGALQCMAGQIQDAQIRTGEWKPRE